MHTRSSDKGSIGGAGQVVFRDGKACILFKGNGHSNVHAHAVNMYYIFTIYKYRYIICMYVHTFMSKIDIDLRACACQGVKFSLYTCLCMNICKCMV